MVVLNVYRSTNVKAAMSRAVGPLSKGGMYILRSSALCGYEDADPCRSLICEFLYSSISEEVVFSLGKPCRESHIAETDGSIKLFYLGSHIRLRRDLDSHLLLCCCLCYFTSILYTRSHLGGVLECEMTTCIYDILYYL